MAVVLVSAASLAETHGCAFVPTMGALHAGHVALIRRASEHGVPVVVSVFVNPTQFGPNEDYQKYPRQLERDVELAGEAGASVVFAPTVEEMYPPGVTIRVPTLPAVATEPGLEDRARPGHFAGVCQVVARLFDLVQPSVAVFGEKDYQQLQVVRAMVRQESPRWSGLRIEGLPTVRESDGLAMSSRNVYLGGEERVRARALSRALHEAARQHVPAMEAETLMRRELERDGLTVEYAVVRDAETLLPVRHSDVTGRALIAARLGRVRLIDNAAMPMCS